MAHVDDPMEARSVLEHLGVAGGVAFMADPQFWIALIAGTAVAFSLGRWGGVTDAGPAPWMVLGIVLWTPVLEELLFRGVIQGELRRRGWGLHPWLGLTRANITTSALFAAAHLLSQSLAWSLAIFAPALVFGYFRDRHDSLWPALILHGVYNGGFVLPGTL